MYDGGSVPSILSEQCAHTAWCFSGQAGKCNAAKVLSRQHHSFFSLLKACMHAWPADAAAVDCLPNTAARYLVCACSMQQALSGGKIQQVQMTAGTATSQVYPALPQPAGRPHSIFQVPCQAVCFSLPSISSLSSKQLRPLHLAKVQKSSGALMMPRVLQQRAGASVWDLLLPQHCPCDRNALSDSNIRSSLRLFAKAWLLLDWSLALKAMIDTVGCAENMLASNVYFRFAASEPYTLYS